MTPITERAQQVFEALVAGLAPGESRKVDTAAGVFMAVSVERLTEATYSLTHYFELNGDLVPDPDMEFWRGADDRIYPVAIQHSTGKYARAMAFTKEGPAVYAAEQLDQARFAAYWLRNIRAQQPEYFETASGPVPTDDAGVQP